jgi:HPt (histidine-containing phosphotransfer) domain-containing protein
MQSPLLDHEQLESFADIGYDDYLELLGDVIHDVPGHLDRIRASIEAGDSAAVKSRVHSFRGMVSYFGCIALTDRLAVMEHHPEIAPDQAATIHSELQNLWDRSLAAIKDWEKSVPDFAPE